MGNKRIWPQSTVPDVMCLGCRSTNVDWDQCGFREFLERDVAMSSRSNFTGAFASKPLTRSPGSFSVVLLMA